MNFDEHDTGNLEVEADRRAGADDDPRLDGAFDEWAKQTEALGALLVVACGLRAMNRRAEAKKMFERAAAEYEGAGDLLGAGIALAEAGRTEDAETMFERVAAEFETYEDQTRGR